MKKERFLAAFILLDLITGLLLVYSVRFFGAWVAPGAAPLLVPNTALRSEPEAALLPTVTPFPTQPPQALAVAVSNSLEQEQRHVEAPPEPVIQVIEELPPDGYLVIPSLGIDAPVVPIAVRGQEWDLETLGSQIGWLQTTGSRPNDDLAMALVGHVTLPHPGGAGPFLNLSTLRPGDVVGYRQGQETYIYEVTGQTIARPHQVEHLYVPDGKRLLLVTCTGYNALEWEYDLRLVVEAKLVSVEK